ncbi:multicopper oxidase family protein [Dongia deserti]|uniref:multicopper oxidase family protein n=1 Tax=Dongia deserti TaxID=2268030 RepID=UPI000E656EF0|nr:multicopper oxidase family protein [Dongia deserti]
MMTEYTSSMSRRSVLLAGAGVALAAATPWRAPADGVREIRLAAAPGRALLVGSDPQTDVLGYDGKVPGPTLRLKQGQPVRIIVENKLDQDTTVHWHGIRLPNAMDGVPGLTQPPIRPGESFTYEFTPPDAGTFWYHPHANSLQQLGRGLAGALIVEAQEAYPADREILWVISDWRLRPDAQIASGFGNPMEAGMSGRVGNAVTINGALPTVESVQAGERIRLRLVNSALARIMALRFEDHRPVIVAIDGQPCDPHEPEGDHLLLGPAMRIDVVLDMVGEPGRRYRVVDDFYDDLAYTLVQLAYDEKPLERRTPLGAVARLSENPIPEPDLASSERHELALQGGMMSGMGRMMGDGMMDRMMDGMMGGGMMDGMMDGMMGGMGGAAWSINGTSMSGDGHAGMKPLLTLKRDRTHILALRNETAWWHPMHLHGHSFLVLSRNGTRNPRREWSDTVLIPPRKFVDVAFVADNPGDWMLHCHVTDHQMSGLMTVLRVA